MASDGGRIGEKSAEETQKGAPQTADFVIHVIVDADLSSLPDHLDALKAAPIAARTETAAEKACAVAAVAELAQGRALIAHLNLEIEKLRADLRTSLRAHGAAADQLELRLEEAEANGRKMPAAEI